MDVLFQRARSFASEAAKRSQDLAKEAAKISQEIATETAKRSKEIATEASKKADQLKTLASDININIPISIPSSTLPLSLPLASSSSSSSAASSSSASGASDEELLKYGITAELREFVRGLTIDTFRDFPQEDFNYDNKEETGNSNVRKDLTDWQEKHALLVLKSVPEISHFRYELCPRVMKEKRFWKIYFTLVRTHVVLYESPTVSVDDIIGNNSIPVKTVSRQIELVETAVPSKSDTVIERTESTSKPPETSSTSQKKHVIDDNDLDAYLLGDDSDGDAEDVGSDPEFDNLVNGTALDSDSEDEEEESEGAKKTTVKPSEASSDGELI